MQEMPEGRDDRNDGPTDQGQNGAQRERETPRSVRMPATSDLRLPSLDHAHEAPKAASMLATAVAEAFRSRTRFPHTAIIGPADSGKRALAAVIADELAVPIVTIDARVMDPDQLHRVLGDLEKDSMVLVINLEGNWWIGPELERAARGERVTRPWTPFNEVHDRGEEWKKAGNAEGYHPFTIVASMRHGQGLNGPAATWAELILHTERTVATERARLERVLRRIGLSVDSDALDTLAQFNVKRDLRTIRVVRKLALWANGKELLAIDAVQMTAALAEIGEHERRADPAPEPNVAMKRLWRARMAMKRPMVGGDAGTGEPDGAAESDPEAANGAAGTAPDATAEQEESTATHLAMIGTVLALALVTIVAGVYLSLCLYRWTFDDRGSPPEAPPPAVTAP